MRKTKARSRRATCPDTDALNARLGKTVARLRASRDLSLSALSVQSGVAKSMISQIEKNEANPSVATLVRLSQALGTSVAEIMATGADWPDTDAAIIEHARKADIPLVMSEDGLCELRIFSSLDSVSWAQTYDFRAMPGGVLDSSPHPDGTIENLSVLSGELDVSLSGKTTRVKTGETLRYRGDRDHLITNPGAVPAHATMVCLCPPRIAAN